MLKAPVLGTAAIETQHGNKNTFLLQQRKKKVISKNTNNYGMLTISNKCIIPGMDEIYCVLAPDFLACG